MPHKPAPPKTCCYDCPKETNGTLLCEDCAAKFDLFRETRARAAGEDRRRRGRGLRDESEGR